MFYRSQRMEGAVLERLGFRTDRIHLGTGGPKIYKSRLRSGFAGRASIPTAIFIRKPFGRFGNQYFQLINALALGNRWGTRGLIAPGNVVVPRMDPLGLQALGWVVKADEQVVNWKPLGDSLFQQIKPRKPALHLAFNTFFASVPGQLEMPVSLKESTDAAQAVANVWAQPAPAPLKESHLVIHLRSGDVFRPDPHPQYGQPPLSFYTKILDHRDWENVTLVRQDATHPLESALASEIARRGIELQLRSGSFDEDLNFLLSASTLVSSLGTFVPAVVGLSKNIKSLYEFEAPHRVARSVSTWRVTDEPGDYRSQLLSQNWEGSKEQIDLMLNYPETRLALEHSPREVA